MNDDVKNFEENTLKLYPVATFKKYPISGSYKICWIQDRWDGWKANSSSSSHMRNKAIEDAAHLADLVANKLKNEHYYPGIVRIVEELAEAIRSLSNCQS